jgi:hypothetical protein
MEEQNCARIWSMTGAAADEIIAALPTVGL